VSTVSQGAIQYHNRLAPTNASTVEIPRLTVLSSQQFFLDLGGDMYLRALDLKRHITIGALTPTGEQTADDPVDCSTGECVFPDFATVGVCSDAADVSDSLVTTRPPLRDWALVGLSSNNTWSAALPGGYNLTIPTLYAFDIFFPRNFVPSISFQHLRNQTFASIYLIYSNLVDPGDPQSEVEFGAAELAWYWCAKAYSVNVTGGRQRRKELSRSTRILNQTSISNNIAGNKQFAYCWFEVIAKCEQLPWGTTTMEPPLGFEEHPPFVIHELSSLGISLVLQQSFWEGLKPPVTSPVYNTSAQLPAQEGIFRARGRKIWRSQSDFGMAFGINLWRDFSGGVDPADQVDALRNITANIATGLEDLYVIYTNIPKST